MANARTHEVFLHWRLGFDSRQELRIFIFATVSRPAPRPTQTSIQRVPGALSSGRGMKLATYLHLVPRFRWSYTSISPIYLHGVVL